MTRCSSNVYVMSLVSKKVMMAVKNEVIRCDCSAVSVAKSDIQKSVRNEKVSTPVRFELTKA